MTKPVKIKTRTVYETEDDETFDSLADATLHQLKWEMQASFEAVEPIRYANDYNAIVEYIWHNRVAFVDALNDTFVDALHNAAQQYKAALIEDQKIEEALKEKVGHDEID